MLQTTGRLPADTDDSIASTSTHEYSDLETTKRLSSERVVLCRGLASCGLCLCLVVGFLGTSWTLWWPAVFAETWMWAGDVTAESFQLRILGDGKLFVATALHKDGGLDPAKVVFSKKLVDRDGSGIPHAVSVSGLSPNTQYFYSMDTAPRDIGRLRTWAGAIQPRLKVGLAACSASNSFNPIYNEIADEKLDLFLHMGDLHYDNIKVNDSHLFRKGFARVHGSSTYRQLFRSMPVAYMWDDHDYGPNDSDRNSPSRDAALEAFNQCVPRPASPGLLPEAVYHAFSVGRTRFLMMDTRSQSEPDVQLMDPKQLRWLQDEIQYAKGHMLLVLMLGQPWIGDEKAAGDGWRGQVATRKIISEAIASGKASGLGYLNVIGVAADGHMLAFDDGTHTDYSISGGAGFPLLQAGPLDNMGSNKGGPYTSECHGFYLGRNNQFGSIEIRDSGGIGADAICVTFRQHRLGGKVFLNHSVCGPLLRSREEPGPSIECNLTLMPTGQFVLFAFFLASLLWASISGAYLCIRGRFYERHLVTANAMLTVVFLLHVIWVGWKTKLAHFNAALAFSMACCLIMSLLMTWQCCYPPEAAHSNESKE